MSDPKLEVIYEAGQPQRIEYYHISHGYLAFQVHGDVARCVPGKKTLRDESWVGELEVAQAVLELPFIEEIQP